jgi:hypothetical protein
MGHEMTFREELIAVRYRAAWVTTALAVTAGSLALPGPASAVEPGFQVRVTESPGTFGAGAESRALTVVVSTDQRRCQKVRWSMLMRVDGPGLSDAKVSRIEENGEFATQRQDQGDVARITDVQVDPGQLCRGRTVTANYRISFNGDTPSGTVTFQPQAFTADGRLLQEASVHAPVVGQKPAEKETTPAPTPEPTETSPSPRESEDEGLDDAIGPEESAEPTGTGAADANTVPAAADSQPPSLLGPGLVVGALLVFAGVGLLLRLRMRNKQEASPMPPGFYPSR